MEKSHIVDAIKHLAAAHGGKAPGRVRFERETGIRMSDWYPHLWLRWGDALVEAGYVANKLQTAISNEILIRKYVDLTRELAYRWKVNYCEKLERTNHFRTVRHLRVSVGKKGY